MINSEFINGLEPGYYIKRNMGTSTFIKDKFYEVYENDGIFYVDDEKGNQVVLNSDKEYWEHEYYKKYELLYVKVNDEISQLKKVNENAVKKIKELKNENKKLWDENKGLEKDNNQLSEDNTEFRLILKKVNNDCSQLKEEVKKIQDLKKKLELIKYIADN